MSYDNEPYVCAEGHVYWEPLEGGGCPRCESEYQQGVQDYENWKWNRAVLGDEEADRIEFERDFNEQ